MYTLTQQQYIQKQPCLLQFLDFVVEQ